MEFKIPFLEKTEKWFFKNNFLSVLKSGGRYQCIDTNELDIEEYDPESGNVTFYRTCK